MRVVMDVTDFGEATVQKSPDNDGCTRLTLDDAFNSFESVHFDLDQTELKNLIRMLNMFVED